MHQFETLSRNDFEYLKYDFRSFTNEISKWQIDVDDRLSEAENQIKGILKHFQIQILYAY